MLSLNHSGRGATLCDGVSRRDFMKIGGLGLGGLSLAQLLQAEAHAGVRNSKKAVKNVFAYEMLKKCIHQWACMDDHPDDRNGWAVFRRIDQ